MRYGPWKLLCEGNRHGAIPSPVMEEENDGWMEKDSDELLLKSWREYSDSATVESAGLRDRDRLMFEFAVQSESGEELIWPREAATKTTAAKGGKVTTTRVQKTALGSRVKAAAENEKLCYFPGFGACGLTNMGNTSWMNPVIQGLGYSPLLRAYLLSSQYKTAGHINRNNPLGTGGTLLEGFAGVLRDLWSGQSGKISPARFRAQLGKANTQFSGADQQDAKEFLTYILDALHEDCNKVRKKPYVEALTDDWVQSQSLAHAGEEAWRRFLRRNRSIIADVAMGQSLCTMTCTECNHASRIFDAFNLLSIPIPPAADVVFLCTVYRRATAVNCPWVLNVPGKGGSSSDGAKHLMTSDSTGGPPSENFVAEQYAISMSSLGDISHLRLQIQLACGISASLLRLCKVEEVLERSDNKSVVATPLLKVVPLSAKEGSCRQLANKNRGAVSNTSGSATLLVAFESTLRPRSGIEGRHDRAVPKDRESENSSNTPSREEQREIERCLNVYGDEQECRLVDTDPLVLAKALSRSLWPRLKEELKLGLRVDGMDNRRNWYPGSVVEIIEDEKEGGDNSKRVRVHFDNFSSKWDETYNFADFKEGRVKPLYTQAVPRSKQTEFLVHHRYTDEESGSSELFGQAFYVECYNEWTSARAGAHILAQTSRFLGTVDSSTAGSSNTVAYEEAQSAISELIDLLVDSDREYVNAALGVLKSKTDDEGIQHSYRNPTFHPSSLSRPLEKEVSALVTRLPFEVRVCTVATTGTSKATFSDEVSFPFSLTRTIGNSMNARNSIVLHWKTTPTDKKSEPSDSCHGATVKYVVPRIQTDPSCKDMLESLANSISKQEGKAGIDLGACFAEFCKAKKLSINEGWRCPRCKDAREGIQRIDLWRLPDLLTLHIKRFSMSTRWREKITTKVNFPLTGLDMRMWCHEEAPLQTIEADGSVYDLIGVINHFGGITGGHFMATVKATACGPSGREEAAAYSFKNGAGTSRLPSDLAESNPNIKTSRAVSQSNEPLWLQFDDELVDPVPPDHVVSEMAYVLFYRRRRMTPANIAHYCTLK